MKPKFSDTHKYPDGYTPSHATDVRKTFERARKRQDADKQERDVKVRELRKKP